MPATEAPYEIELLGAHAAVTIRPNLVDADWSEIKRAGDDILSRIHDHKPRKILVDLAQLDYMGSSLVALIIRCWKEARPQIEQFVVVTDSSVVREVLTLSGLAKMWEVVATREEAVRLLGVANGSRSPRRLMALGLTALVVCLVGLGVWAGLPPQRALATWLIYSGALSGAILGLALMLRRQSGSVGLGLALILICCGAGVFRLLQS